MARNTTRSRWNIGRRRAGPHLAGVGELVGGLAPPAQQLAFSFQPQSKEGAVSVGVNLAGWSGQVTLEEVPSLERGYGLSALRQPCEVDPELGVVLACCSLAADGQAGMDGEWSGRALCLLSCARLDRGGGCPGAVPGGVLPASSTEYLLKARDKMGGGPAATSPLFFHREGPQGTQRKCSCRSPTRPKISHKRFRRLRSGIGF